MEYTEARSHKHRATLGARTLHPRTLFRRRTTGRGRLDLGTAMGHQSRPD